MGMIATTFGLDLSVARYLLVTAASETLDIDEPSLSGETSENAGTKKATLALPPSQILAAFKQYQGKVFIFHESGRLYLDRSPNLLDTLLDRFVFPIQVAESTENQFRSFHPKILFQAFESLENPKKTACRLTISSRNLTAPRETLLELAVSLEGGIEGEKKKAPKKFGDDVADFLENIYTASRSSAKSGKSDFFKTLVTICRKTHFDAPGGIRPESIQFLSKSPSAQGLATKSGLFSGDEYLKIPEGSAICLSPFVDHDTLDLTKPAALITSNAYLEKIGAYEKLQAMVNQEDPSKWPYGSIHICGNSGKDVQVTDPAEPVSDEPYTEISGLHAKLFAWNESKRLRILMGSSNFTKKGLGGKGNWEANLLFELDEPVAARDFFHGILLKSTINAARKQGEDNKPRPWPFFVPFKNAPKKEIPTEEGSLAMGAERLWQILRHHVRFSMMMDSSTKRIELQSNTNLKEIAGDYRLQFALVISNLTKKSRELINFEQNGNAFSLVLPSDCYPSGFIRIQITWAEPNLHDPKPVVFYLSVPCDENWIKNRDEEISRKIIDSLGAWRNYAALFLAPHGIDIGGEGSGRSVSGRSGKSAKGSSDDSLMNIVSVEDILRSLSANPQIMMILDDLRSFNENLKEGRDHHFLEFYDRCREALK